MALNFPNSPTLGQEYVGDNGVTYQWDGVVWAIFTTDSGDAFLTNSNTITSSYTIPTGRNAISVGPLEIEDGVVVTIPDGHSWVVV